MLAKAREHFDAGRISKAEKLAITATTRAANHFAAALFLGSLYVHQNKVDDAVPLLRKAVQLQPNNVDALYALGVALIRSGHGEEGDEYSRRACEINPNHVDSLTNIGLAFYDKGKIEEAVEYYNRAIACTGETKKAFFNKGIALLALGQYREGWKLYEEGFGDFRGANIFAPVPPWGGMPGKHLLIWCEQGLGDCLQFVRYAELCKTRFEKVSVLCSTGYTSLLRLFSVIPFVDDVFNRPDYVGRNTFDTHVPMLSLPHRFDTVLETIPNRVPYLRVASEIQSKWAPKFAHITGLKVGLVWEGSGRLARYTDQWRNIALERIKGWLDLQGVQFFSLQKDNAPEQIAALGVGDRLIHFMDEARDFADTAAIIQNLDLVISVDTAVAHLAGGLGKPVWILSRYGADWRWLQNRPTNPWYPTARIFGQPTMGDWDSVIAEVERELKAEIEKRAPQAFRLSSFRG